MGLVDHITQRRCVLFLGPDAGETAGGYRGLPTSWQLADELAARCGHRSGYRPLAQIAQIYEHELGRISLVHYLRDRLSDPAFLPLPIHHIIARLPFGVIVHAGWDDLLERTLDELQIRYQRVLSAVELAYLTPTSELVIYKPYGSLDQPETLVITEDDQLNVFYKLRALKQRLADLVASNSLLLVGYAPNYDSVLVRIYHEIRLEFGEHRLPAFVVEPQGQPDDAAQWTARGFKSVVAEPVAFLYGLAQQVSTASDQPLTLPALESISQAPMVTEFDLVEQTQTLNRVLEGLGVGDLVEQTDVMLLNPEQVRDLDAMRAAYDRLASGLKPVPSSAQVWLRQGNVEYVRQNYDNALHYYNLALTADPALPEIHLNLHYVHMVQGDWTAALHAYQQAVSLKPELAILPSRYEISGVLGRGGVGTVYQATDRETGQTVAVKVLNRSFMLTQQVVRRFQREAELLQRLSHPHIVDYIDFQLYQGRYFLVMEYLGQETLASLLGKQSHLSIDDANAIFQQVCQALSFAHELHIIHRDIKPANIFLQNGQVKLIDFGLAADLRMGQPSLVGQATGTIAYMSPEQVRGADVDERTDVYALGTILYEMLTGRQPSQGAYRAPSELNPNFNSALDIAVQKARELDPDQRYPSVDLLAQEVANIVPLQAGSTQAPLWLRYLSKGQQAIRQLVTRYWPVLLIAIAAIGFLFPHRVFVTGLLLWGFFLAVLMTEWFTAWLARDSGYPSLAANGAALGSIFALVVGGVFVIWVPTDAFTVGSELYLNYILLLIVFGVFIVAVTALCLLSMLLAARVAIRLGFGPRARFALTLVLLLIVLLGYTASVLSNFR